MAISFVAAGTPSGAYQAGTSPLAVNIPAVLDNDFMLLIPTRTDDAGTYNTPAGWTSIPQHHISAIDSGDRSAAAFYKFASSEGASVSITNTDTASTGIGAMILAWRGVDLTTPLDVTPTADNTQYNVDDCTPAPITTVSNNALVVVWASPRAYSAEYASANPPLGFTERADVALTDYRINVSEFLQAMAGTVTPGFVEATGGTNINDWLTGTLALRPAVAPGGGGVPQMTMGNNLGRSLINGGQIR